MAVRGRAPKAQNWHPLARWEITRWPLRSSESYESSAGLEAEPVPQAPLAAPPSLALGVPLAPAIIFETFIGIFLEAPPPPFPGN